MVLGCFFGPPQYLNTVIPYEKKGSPPSVEDLQMLTNSECLSGAKNAARGLKLLVWGKICWFGEKNWLVRAAVLGKIH